MDFPRKEAPSLDCDEIQFQITDWYIPESDKKQRQFEEGQEPDVYQMIVYGVTQDGYTVSLRVEGYEPYFYIKPPEQWDGYSNKLFIMAMKRLEATMRDTTYPCIYNKDGVEIKYNKKIIPTIYENHLSKIEMVKKKDFWGFTNNKEFRFIKITAKSLVLYNNLKYYFQSLKKKGFKLYESNIDPFLRFVHEQNIKPCGWISVTEFSDETDDKYNTRCDYNLQTYYKNINPYDKNNIAPLLIASFDIECMSSHGDFPVAKKDYRKVAQDLANISKAEYEITSDLLTYWLENIYKRDIIIDDKVKIHRAYAKNHIDFSLYKQKIIDNSQNIIDILNKICGMNADTCDIDSDIETDGQPVKGITVKQQNALESELNNILTDILPELNGDKIIQIGTTVHRYGSDAIIYKNIITLDTCDLIENADVISCQTEQQLLLEWKKLINSLNPDIITGYNIFGFDMEYIWIRAKENGIIDKLFKGFGRNLTRKSDLLTKKLSSSALGENILKYFDMDGVVLIDLFKVMQRDHKLDSYKLDNVAQIFLGDKKDDLKPHEIFEKFEGTSADRCIIAKYCIQDCALVNGLLHKLKILENNLGMGNVCLVPLSFLFMRGQGIKIFSLIAKECMDKGYLIPVIKSTIYDDEEDGYEGAVVLDPKEGMYLNDPIVVFDYGSLYPSSMIARNLSHDCYVLDEKYKVEDPAIDYITVAYDIYEGCGDKKKKVGIKECIFAQYKDGRRGVIADILCMLLAQRKDTRNKMEYQTIKTKNGQIFVGIVSEDNESYKIVNIDTDVRNIIHKNDVCSISDTYSKFEQDVFDALQLAYKITANSLYGQIGARTSPIYLKDIAACTTATGREMIMKAKDYVTEKYGADVIYGDTDSIFCKFPLKDENGNPVYGKQALPYAIKVGQDVEKNIASIMPYPQKLNYEKSLYPFILFSKKRYVGNLYETDVNKFKQKSMGIVLKRRDNAPIVKKIYGGIIDILLNQQDLNLSLEFLKDELKNLVDGKTAINDLVISKSLRASYKDPLKIPHKVLADRISERDPGNKPQVNDRIPFAYIKVPDAKLQGDRIEHPEYIIENKLVPDYLHYITNQIMNPVLQLYALCLDELPNYEKTSEYWCQLEESLKQKPMYQDDVRRQNRLINLRLQMVKELLFDEFINILKEPVEKKDRKVSRVSKVKKAEQVISPRQVYRGEVKIGDILPETNTVLHATIAVTKKIKTDITVSSAIILNTNKKQKGVKGQNGSKILWSYEHENIMLRNKTTEIIAIITDMIVFAKEHQCKLEICLKNNKPFISEYKRSIVEYEEIQNTASMYSAVEGCDLGIMKSSQSIVAFEPLFIARNLINFKE
jgi:DNA polymerase elongation subunit (family B)